MELGVNFGAVSSSQIFLVILNVLIMSPLQRLKRRVGRYFKRSEYMIIFYNHKPVLLTFFLHFFNFFNLPYRIYCLLNLVIIFFHHHFICSVKCKNTVEKNENYTEQGEPGSYERLRKPLHRPIRAYSLSNHIA